MGEENRSGSDESIAQVRRAQEHLRRADPVIGHLIDLRPDFDPYAWLTDLPPMTLFGSLLFQITGQQLSVAATRRTIERIRALFAGQLPAPEELLTVEPAELRAAGLSWRKVETIRDLAERFADGRLDADSLAHMTDDDFIRELTLVPGIGPWTAQGALLVALRREDVVLPGDLALRKAIRRAYRLDHLPTQDEVLQIAEPWRPYRSLATSYLFAGALEPVEEPPL
jgi:DNA-3-methyladenine glycosylase II